MPYNSTSSSKYPNGKTPGGAKPPFQRPKPPVQKPVEPKPKKPKSKPKKPMF